MKATHLKPFLITAVLAWSTAAHAESDAWITTKAKLALWKAGDVRSTEVHVDTIDGVVTLYGSVASDAQKQKAEKTARGIKGVTAVRDLLQVVPPAEEKATAASDHDIKNAVERAIKDDPALEDAKVTVKSVNKGIVLLGGKVATLMDHLTAIQDADSVPGVRRVSSEIEGPKEIMHDEERVVYTPRAGEEGRPTSMSDMRITSEVKMKLLGDSETPGTKINVDTTGGHVTLFGMVNDDNARAAAEADAFKVKGVKFVKNEIQVVPAANEDEVKATDDDIKKKAKELLGKHSEYKDIDVDVKNGVVRLTGKVPSSWDRMHASALTRNLSGARAVETDVAVKPTKK